MVKKLFLIAALFSQAAFAGQYAQQLSDCAYNNLNSQDKKILTQWAFVSLGKTKAAKEVTVIPAQKITATMQPQSLTLTFQMQL